MYWTKQKRTGIATCCSTRNSVKLCLSSKCINKVLVTAFVNSKSYINVLTIVYSIVHFIWIINIFRLILCLKVQRWRIYHVLGEHLLIYMIFFVIHCYTFSEGLKVDF